MDLILLHVFHCEVGELASLLLCTVWIPWVWHSTFPCGTVFKDHCRPSLSLLLLVQCFVLIQLMAQNVAMTILKCSIHLWYTVNKPPLLMQLISKLHLEVTPSSQVCNHNVCYVCALSATIKLQSWSCPSSDMRNTHTVWTLLREKDKCSLGNL